jgi:hypothetical protein
MHLISGVDIRSPKIAPDAIIQYHICDLLGEYSYKVSYVSSFGETRTSPASNVVSVNKNVVDLVNIPTFANSGVVARNIYRTKRNEKIYYLLARINITDTTYTDSALDDKLGEVEPEFNTAISHLGFNGWMYYTRPVIYSFESINKNNSIIHCEHNIITEPIEVYLPNFSKSARILFYNSSCDFATVKTDNGLFQIRAGQSCEFLMCDIWMRLSSYSTGDLDELLLLCKNNANNTDNHLINELKLDISKLNDKVDTNITNTDNHLINELKLDISKLNDKVNNDINITAIKIHDINLTINKINYKVENDINLAISKLNHKVENDINLAISKINEESPQLETSTPDNVATNAIFAEFYGNNEVCVVKSGTPIPFAEMAISVGIDRVDAFRFKLPVAGTYEVSWNISLEQSAEFAIYLNKTAQSRTSTKNNTGNNIINTTSTGVILELRNISMELLKLNYMRSIVIKKL